MSKKSGYFKKLSLIIAASIFPWIGISSITTPAHAASDYSLSGSYASLRQGPIARANGFIFAYKGLTEIIKYSESSETVTQIINTGSSTIFDLVSGGDVVVGAKSDGTLYYIDASNFGSYTPVPWTPCGSSWNARNGIAVDENYILITCVTGSTGQIYLYSHNLPGYTIFSPLAEATVTWKPGKLTLANGYAYVANLNASNDIKKFSLADFNAAPYTNTTLPAAAFPITSIAVASDALSSDTRVRVTSDSANVWIISGANNSPYKLTKISIATDAFSTFLLTDYVAGSPSPLRGMGDISSDGTTVFISFSTNDSVAGFNIATSNVSLLATPPLTSTIGVQAGANSFFVSGSNGFLRYSLPKAVNTDSSAEARKKRQEAIDAARNALVAKIKAGETIVNSDFIAADVTQFNSDLAKRANAEFQTASRSKSFGFADVKTIVTKWGIYQDIQNGVRSNVTGRLAYQAGIIPGSVKLKQTLIAKLMNTEASERSSVEKIDALIATLAKKQSDQEDRKVAIINKITSGK